MRNSFFVSKAEPRTANAQNTTSASAPFLFDGEDVLIDARPAWTAWTVQLILAGIFALGGLVASETPTRLLAFIIAIALVGYVWYQRQKVRYLVTDRRILVVTGLSSQATNEVWMVDVRGMQTGSSLIERLLGHGHITVSSSILSRGSLLSISGQLQGLTLGGIGNYQEVADVIRKRQADAKR